MAGTADIHLLYGLENTTRAYLADEAAFKALFIGLSDELLSSWYQTLSSKPPEFRGQLGSGFNEESAPWVILTLAEEGVDERPLGDLGGKSAGQDKIELLVRQDVRVTILCWNPEILRALHVVLRAGGLQLKEPLLSAGYDDFYYVGCDALSPQEELISLELGIAARVQRYSTNSLVSVTEVSTKAPAFRWFIQLDDVQMDPAWGVVEGALPGGVQIPAEGAGET